MPEPEQIESREAPKPKVAAPPTSTEKDVKDVTDIFAKLDAKKGEITEKRTAISKDAPSVKRREMEARVKELETKGVVGRDAFEATELRRKQPELADMKAKRSETAKDLLKLRAERKELSRLADPDRETKDRIAELEKKGVHRSGEEQFELNSSREGLKTRQAERAKAAAEKKDAAPDVIPAAQTEQKPEAAVEPAVSSKKLEEAAPVVAVAPDTSIEAAGASVDARSAEAPAPAAPASTAAAEVRTAAEAAPAKAERPKGLFSRVKAFMKEDWELTKERNPNLARVGEAIGKAPKGFMNVMRDVGSAIDEFKARRLERKAAKVFDRENALQGHADQIMGELKKYNNVEWASLSKDQRKEALKSIRTMAKQNDKLDGKLAKAKERSSKINELLAKRNVKAPAATAKAA